MKGYQYSVAIAIFFYFQIQAVHSQELITTEFQKGYVKEGKKVLVWEYYNYNKELELKINHTSGKVYYLKEDSSQFVIFKDGEWTAQKIRVYPIPITGYQNFFNHIVQNLRYPLEARRTGIEGEVLTMFEVDTLGLTSNITLVKDIGGGCGNEVLRLLQQADFPWIPAQIDGIRYKSRFIMPLIFSLGGKHTPTNRSDLPLAKKLRVTVSSAYFKTREVPSTGNLTSGKIAGITIKDNTGTIHSLDEALRSRKKVERLSMVDTQLKFLSPEIGKLNDLRVLDLEGNVLTELPKEIGKLEQLEELFIPGNKLKNLPKEILSLKDLKLISLASNQFREFPEQICAFSELAVLDIRDNNIGQIPSCIGNLKKLELILLENCNLKTLPAEFFQLRKLKKIFLKGNPLDKESIEKIKSTFRKAEVVI